MYEVETKILDIEKDNLVSLLDEIGANMVPKIVQTSYECFNR